MTTASPVYPCLYPPWGMNRSCDTRSVFWRVQCAGGPMRGCFPGRCVCCATSPLTTYPLLWPPGEYGYQLGPLTTYPFPQPPAHTRQCLPLACSTPRATFEEKLSKKPELRQLLRHVVCGDEVRALTSFMDLILICCNMKKSILQLL